VPDARHIVVFVNVGGQWANVADVRAARLLRERGRVGVVAYWCHCHSPSLVRKFTVTQRFSQM